MELFFLGNFLHPFDFIASCFHRTTLREREKIRCCHVKVEVNVYIEMNCRNKYLCKSEMRSVPVFENLNRTDKIKKKRTTENHILQHEIGILQSVKEQNKHYEASKEADQNVF